MHRHKVNKTLSSRTVLELPQDNQDKATFYTTAFETPRNNQFRKPTGRHGQSFYPTGTPSANRKGENSCANDVSPCLRASLKRYPSGTGLISKARRKLCFHRKEEELRNTHLSGKGKRPAKFASEVGLVSEQDLPCLSWNTIFTALSYGYWRPQLSCLLSYFLLYDTRWHQLVSWVCYPLITHMPKVHSWTADVPLRARSQSSYTTLQYVH